MHDFFVQYPGFVLGWGRVFLQTHRKLRRGAVVFTIFMRLIIVPLSIKQQKSTVENALLSRRWRSSEKNYANNKEKLNEEMMKLYQKEGYNPMAGCLPLLIQLPFSSA